ncbi:hypothetical protein D6821_00990, partial [Candidatus Parcubacteria bacterium]
PISFPSFEELDLGRLSVQQFKERVEQTYLKPISDLAQQNISSPQRLRLIHLLQQLGVFAQQNKIKELGNEGFKEFYYRLLDLQYFLISGGVTIVSNRDRQWRIDLIQQDQLSWEEVMKADKILQLFTELNSNIELPRYWKQIDYEQFIPEIELQKIKRQHFGSVKEKQAKLAEYKEQYNRQRRGIALTIEYLAEAIKNNKFISQEELISLVYQAGREFSFSNHQLILFEKAIDKFIKRREAVRSLQQRAGTDAEKFKILFGREPKGEIRIFYTILGPYIQCSNDDDFVYIWRQRFDSTPPSSQEKEKIKKIGGLAVNRCLVDGLKRGVMVERTQPEQLGRRRPNTFRHEMQHLFNHFILQADFQISPSTLFLNKLSPRLQEEWLSIYFQRLRQRFEGYAKNEILAHLRGGTDPKQIETLLLPVDDSMAYYNYAHWWRHSLEGKGVWQQLVSYGIATKKLEEIFYQRCVSDYRVIVREAIIALRHLRDEGWNIQRIIAFLGSVPLRYWPSAVRRLRTS